MKHSPDDVGGFGPQTHPTTSPRGFCYFCSADGPREAFAPRRLRADHDPYPGCIDHEACDGRARARGGADHFARELGRKTPPGVALVAVLLAAGCPVPHRSAQCAVERMRRYVPDDHGRAYASDLAHAVASGIVASDHGAATYAPGVRFEAIAASVRASPAHVDGARHALAVEGFLPPATRGHFLDRYTRGEPASAAGAPSSPGPATAKARGIRRGNTRSGTR